MKSLAFGPYIGDFKYEVFYFLPYIKWVKEILNPEHIYVSSHYNRRFLYNNLATDFYDINPIFTMNEFDQKNHLNKNIFKAQYLLIEKEFKSKFDDDVFHYSFDYNRFKEPCSTFQLKYSKLNFDIKYRYSNKILFIPDRVEKDSYLKEIYSYLYSKLGDRLIVIGDKKTHLHDKNIILNSLNYTSNVYKETIDAICSCSAVICPASIWTAISNLQGTNVFSWGRFISKYKDGSKYSFGNHGSYYPKLEVNKIKNCLDKFLEEKC